MHKFNRIKALITLVLITIFTLAIFSANASSDRGDAFSEIEEKLSGISAEEKDILQNLFTLSQEIELLEAEERKLSIEAEEINGEIGELEALIAEGEGDYEKKHESLKRVFRSYQRMGPGSFLEIILDSDSLDTFLHRINIVRDLVRNTGELIDRLEEKVKELSDMKSLLSDKLVIAKDKQRQAREALEKKAELRLEKEVYLLSLMEEKRYYQEYLTGIEEVWKELKPIVPKAVKEFSRIIEEGSLPTDALKINFSFFSVRGSIEDEIINKVISEQSELSAMQFAFHPGKVEISLPDKNFSLSGTFVVLKGHSLKFQAQEGSFFGMPLKEGSLEELFKDGDLILNLESLLAGNVIDEVEIKEGYLEFISKLKLF